MILRNFKVLYYFQAFEQLWRVQRTFEESLEKALNHLRKALEKAL
jgi:DNA-binding winged helix-turn-helix (wHTH) protein